MILTERLELDLYGTIKLINYIRSKVNCGDRNPQVHSAALFQDDKYLQPVLEDDALLFSIGDLVDVAAENGEVPAPAGDKKAAEDPVALLLRVGELEEQLRRVHSEYSAFRAQVAETLDKRWNDVEPNEPGTSGSSAASKAKSKQDDTESGYFESYSYNDIHETMLRDTVRTDAYRDFIYDNKHLFAGKTVLDVGCGTGILSMFCAKAGAAKVLAVDNSAIIDKARVNVVANGLGDIVTCMRGKIEEVTLPVAKVDIIVSEWMGYCLLFEAMLDSVLWARNRYLKPDGLMVPSHCVLHIAPVADSEYVADTFGFWRDVYGFDMRAMMEKMYDDVLVTQLRPEDLATSRSTAFFSLPLHSVSKEDLEFRKSFQATLSKDVESLDGWCVWFDTFFLPSRLADLPLDPDAKNCNLPQSVAFTTGPMGKETHWKSGVMVIDRQKQGRLALKTGTSISGTVGYKKGSENARGLEIEVDWKVEESKVEGKQTWCLR